MNKIITAILALALAGSVNGQSLANVTYDFIAGDKIIYNEDFSGDALGELPMGWNSNGKAALVTMDAFPGNWMKMYQNSFYLTANKTAFSKNFTAEFDIILQFNYKSYTFPLITFGLLASNDLKTTDNSLLTNPSRFQAAEILLRPGKNGTSLSGLRTMLDKKEYFKGQDQKLESLEPAYNKVTHVAMQAQESRLRVWVNGQKVFDAPQALATQYVFNQLFFKIHNSGYKENEIGFYLSNLKVATGIPDSRHKLLKEGKFSTTAILFDVNTATLRTESYGVIKEIATILKENAGLRINIIGHTDSDGADAANLVLSQKRAAAVKEALVKELGIDASRINTTGKGETQPIADNKTKESKAANRRVEFIKQ